MRIQRYDLHVDLGSCRTIVILYGLASATLLGLALHHATGSLIAQLLWTRVEGQVVGIDYEGSHRSRRPYARFSFTTPDGRPVHARTPHTSAFHPAKIGDSVQVAFSPRDPSKAELIQAGHLYAFPILHLLAAIFCAWLLRRHFDGAINLTVLPAPDTDAARPC